MSIPDVVIKKFFMEEYQKADINTVTYEFYVMYDKTYTGWLARRVSGTTNLYVAWTWDIDHPNINFEI